MKTILVIEDNRIMRENISEILGLSNYHVLSATNGIQGMELAVNKEPDLIICDVMMPELDGLELLKKIRRTPGISNTPFVLVTARAEKSDICDGIRMGANEYLTKPFDGEDLLHIAAKYIRVENLKDS